MAKVFKCYLIPKKSYGTLSKDAIFFGQPCIMHKKKDSFSKKVKKSNVSIITHKKLVSRL